jgi:hypothetical protein
MLTVSPPHQQHSTPSQSRRQRADRPRFGRWRAGNNQPPAKGVQHEAGDPADSDPGVVHSNAPVSVPRWTPVAKSLQWRAARRGRKPRRRLGKPAFTTVEYVEIDCSGKNASR